MIRQNRGIVSASLILLSWAGLWIRLIWIGKSQPPGAGELMCVPLFAFVYTGLFITAHDAMHSSLAPRHPRLNRWLGSASVRIFALFSYQRLLKNHRLHHQDPTSATDPDFSASRWGWPGWFLSFFTRYVTVWQFLGLALLSQGLHSLGGVAWERIIGFQVIPPVLATLQLFHFGTYLPHRRTPQPYLDRHRTRSNAYPEWLSFLTCYHFGYHHEHHCFPNLPWFELPRARRTFALPHARRTKTGAVAP